MYEATVISAFICKHDGRTYRRRETYRHKDADRMKELAARGRVKFTAPKPQPERKLAAKGKAKKGDS